MIGISEIFIILLAIIIFLRPDDWPKLVYHVGKWYRNWQHTYARVMNEIQEIKDLADKKYNYIEEPSFREPFTSHLSTDKITEEPLQKTHEISKETPKETSKETPKQKGDPKS